MQLKLYALKCEGGYIRFNATDGSRCFGLNKASVYDCPDHGELQEAMHQAKNAGIKDLRLVELNIEEREYIDA